ncbi:hypothetical protein KAM622c_43190 [Klebsiella quasipneumoniae subsp. quasipneumoniae]|nr:hypothetical protein KAM622c_43190 [Klebsiella quasipneumoniae subsp. quasipneumoniae]
MYYPFYGFKVVIAPSFADIFYGNSFNNQLLPVTLSQQKKALFFDFSPRYLFPQRNIN